jgi:hypothetical protein
MQPGEGPSGGEAGEAREDRRDHHDPQRIGVGGGDDQMARIQLAARWSEAFAPEDGDSLGNMLKRFRTAYDYLDAVIHGVEPADVEDDQRSSSASSHGVHEPAPVGGAEHASPTIGSAEPTQPRTEPEPQGETRPTWP